MDKIPDKVLDLEADVRGLIVWINKLEDRVKQLEAGHTCPKHGSTLTCPVCEQEGGIY